MRLSNSLPAKNGKSNPRLVFHRYGEQYFLAEIWNGDFTGRQLMRSSKEKALQRDLATIASKSDHAAKTYELVEVVAIAR